MGTAPYCGYYKMVMERVKDKAGCMTPGRAKGRPELQMVADNLLFFYHFINNFYFCEDKFLFRDADKAIPSMLTGWTIGHPVK